ncbi:MAG TPA: cysteine desulfurase family protein [Bdellovibrionales bacterium]|nr:cysteine desulfurase family protein [Bdellovibrionales bacterium]
MPNNRIYLDHNATTPLDPEVKRHLSEWAELFGNPSSIHWGGRGPKTAMRDARKHFAAMIGGDPLEIVFTSGGSEANNLAIKGVFYTRPKERNHYLFSSVEHPSVTQAMDFLRRQGAEVEVFDVGFHGALDLDLFKSKLRPTTALVSCMLANNETGAVFPVRKMAKLAHEAGALFHSDCVQALGKISFDVKSLGVDLASFSGHKFYSLKGAGALYARKGLTIEPLIHGGGQERHRRAGTENTLAIAALGHMATKATLVRAKGEELARLRDRFEAAILERIPGAHVTSKDVQRLPNTSSLVLDGVEGETLLMNLDMEGFAVSTGAACSSGSPEPSPTLLAMGLTRREAQSSLRVSFGWQTTDAQVDEFIETLVRVVARQRRFTAAESQREAPSAALQ